ncbi:hypothetical protein Bca52824_079714 [Brassica carinata]|uniref:Uncharacterized protein n=1 Tax=Brassica carinata TaxID=52824 RepID=A0A8X7PZ26_BRACI|nr:hypothetical protein Bca52824_079714 [Brassica carinata]
MDPRKSADGVKMSVARAAAADMQSPLTFMERRNKTTVIDTEEAMGYGDDGSELFEGTRDLRRVVVKRFEFSDEAYEATYREAKIHHRIENDVENIVQLYDIDVCGSYIYLSFKPWTSTFGDLIRICGSKCTPRLTEVRRSFLKEFLGDIKLWETSGGPSFLLVDVVSCVCELHGANIIHRDLNPDCFFMIRKGNTFRSRIGNLRLFFAFSITKGIEVFERDGRYNSTAKAILESLPESHQFFKNCIRTPVDLRRVLTNLVYCSVTAQRALLEPFFWSTDKTVRFYNIANTLLARTWSEDLRDSLHNLKGKVLKRPHQGWIRSLKPDFQTIVSSDRRSFYDRYNITHLVKLVRNRLAHYDQQDQEEDEGLQEILGTTQKDVLEYFRASFPQLLLQTYHVINKHFQTDPAFLAFAEGNAPQVPVSDQCMEKVSQRLSYAKESACRNVSVQSHGDPARKLQKDRYDDFNRFERRIWEADEGGSLSNMYSAIAGSGSNLRIRDH